MGWWGDGGPPPPLPLLLPTASQGLSHSLHADLLRPDGAHCRHLHHHHHLQVRPLSSSVGEEWSGAGV